VAKTEKPATGKAATGKAASAKSPPAEASTGKTSAGMNKIALFIVGALAAAAVVGGIVYYHGGFEQADEGGPKKDPDVAELMAPGPLPDMVLGKPDAPYTIVEYASMTCSHCARFHNTVLPELKTKYIDTGQAKLILREFPLDGLAVAAFMLARCSGPDRYYPMVGGLFETQETWAVPGGDGKEKLLLIAKQAGFSKERFDQCVADKDMFNKIVEVRQQAHDQFGVDSTPSFFINGKRLTGEHELKDFEAMLAGSGNSEGSAGAPEGSASPAGEAPSQPEGGASPEAGGASQPEGAPAQ
jgi:protein-disulfide isomerase